ncbi:DUF636 domain protein [Lophium mytilinum]|uniref:DUF636 domain protein n=1 Tax=Lophium mytilinum TaxID=390894 RepID=A0A6A6QME2_9PEZI|nr:DUF636 domain protein [Lophium mytilinum]
MPSASCLCGAVKLSYTGAPVTTFLCHCAVCKKITGSDYSTNIVVPDAAVTHPADSKPMVEYVMTTDSNNRMTSFLCGTCGSTMYRRTPFFAGLTILKAGLMDKEAEDGDPAFELWAGSRSGWVAKVDGTIDCAGQQELVQ